MTGALASTWYRISAMRPRLRAHAQIHRQVYRGETWYILQDHQSGLFFRVSPAANLMLCCMDGRRTMQQILDIAGKRFGDAEGRVPATFDILFLTAWKPHASQPRPLPRGSGKVSLAEHLAVPARDPADEG